MSVKDLKKNLRKYRKRCGLSQKQLGERSGYAEISIRQMETGIFFPTLAGLERIATALSVDAKELI